MYTNETPIEIKRDSIFLDSVFLYINFCIASNQDDYFRGPKHVVSEYCR